MEYIIGVLLGLGIGLLTSRVGLDRDRALYPVMLIVVASYYDLFAVMGGGAALVAELGASAIFVLAALFGFRTNLWVVVVAVVGHGVQDAGVPDWWPMFCASIDVVIGLHLAWRLYSGKIAASDPTSFGSRISPSVEREIVAAKAAQLAGESASSFHHLERAHVLGQGSTLQHVRVHVHMLMWGIRRHNMGEAVGQIVRVIGAATKTWAGLIPHGNTGGSNVSAFKAMPIADELANLIAGARTPAEKLN
jgi:Protein of unknown function (DUF3703)